MKKILFGLVLGIVLAIPVEVFAWSSGQIATPTFVARCDGSSGSLDPNSCDIEVAKYNDRSNTCYVSYIATNSHFASYVPTPAISCVKD